MTPRSELVLQCIVALVVLSNSIPVQGSRADWVTKLEQRRMRIQSDIDLLIKYFCSNDQSDVNCQRRLPQLREELRQTEEQLVGYTREERRRIVQDTYQKTQREVDDYRQMRNYVPDEQHSPQRDSRQIEDQRSDVQHSNHRSFVQGTHQRPRALTDQRLIDLIRRRSYVQAEQQLLNQLSEVNSIIQDLYDNRSENFNILVDFASAVRDGELKFLIYKSLLEETIRRGHDDPLKIVRLTRGLQDEVVLGNSIDDDIHTKATNMVDNLKLLFESAVAKLWIESTINHFFEQDTNLPRLADEISTLDSALFTRIISKVIAGLYTHIDTEHLMRNMEKFHLVPQLIDAYNAIYNQMAQNNDINGKRYILKLGYYLKELLQRSNSTRLQLSPEKKTQLLLLEQKLPVSIRSLVFSDRVCLKSKYVHDYLHIAHGHPRLLRYAIMAPGTQLRWKPKRVDYSIFFEFPYGGYLFADDRNLDGRNRLVAASQNSDDTIEGSEWKIEPNGDDCFIKNVAYNELLYVGDEFDEDHRSYKVFTTVGNAAEVTSDDRFKWTIEAC